jgi:hypothetical protein
MLFKEDFLSSLLAIRSKHFGSKTPCHMCTGIDFPSSLPYKQSKAEKKREKEEICCINKYPGWCGVHVCKPSFFEG